MLALVPESFVAISFRKALRMLESLQLPILVVALGVMSWAVIRLGMQAKGRAVELAIPAEVLRCQAELKQLTQDLQTELDEKMAAVHALSQAYEQASRRLSDLIDDAREIAQPADEADESAESSFSQRRSA